MLKTLSLLLALAFAARCAHAEESLYERKGARKPTAAEQRNFGPKSGSQNYDARMIRAMEIARQRAHRKTTWHCWGYVKDALLAANVVSTRPTTAWAKQAGGELTRKYGFKKLATLDPMRAPVGAVVVYGGSDAGHVEIRTPSGFVSDFFSSQPYPRPVVGIYVKQS